MLPIKKIMRFLVVLFSGLLLFGCSGDDSAEATNYFSADIEGKQLLVDEFSGKIESDKRVSDFGTIDLFVKVENNEGESIEFLIHNYAGKRKYSIGRGIYNESWIRYSQREPAGAWNANKGTAVFSVYQNNIEITDDTGEFITGKISFQGFDTSSNSIKMVTKGDFNLSY